jgi:hypothetical protein
MRKSLALVSLFILILMALSCTSSGLFLATNQTNVKLAEPNYTIIAKNIVGESTAAYVFGLSFSNAAITQTLAIARISGTGMLYAEAVKSLWSNFESKHGAIEGKKLALVNIRYDADMINLFVYTKVKLYIRADIVEFGQ